MTSKQELSLLKARTKALGNRLDELNRRMRKIQPGTGIRVVTAVVGSEKCLGCGACEAACPVGAIALRVAAFVNPLRCIGCGRCVDVCSGGAIRLERGMRNREGKPERMN